MSQSVHYEPLDVRQCWGLLFLPPAAAVLEEFVDVFARRPRRSNTSFCRSIFVRSPVRDKRIGLHRFAKGPDAATSEPSKLSLPQGGRPLPSTRNGLISGVTPRANQSPNLVRAALSLL